jgi:hypothetical protein
LIEKHSLPSKFFSAKIPFFQNKKEKFGGKLGKRVNLLYNGSWSFLDYSSNPIFLALWD